MFLLGGGMNPKSTLQIVFLVEVLVSGAFETCAEFKIHNYGGGGGWLSWRLIEGLAREWSGDD